MNLFFEKASHRFRQNSTPANIKPVLRNQALARVCGGFALWRRLGDGALSGVVICPACAPFGCGKKPVVAALSVSADFSISQTLPT
jgi:hypothetical protein